MIASVLPPLLQVSGNRMTNLPDVEDRMIVCSFVCTKHRNATDGRTDGQTDRYSLATTAVCIACNADAL